MKRNSGRLSEKAFYKDILIFFNDLKALYSWDGFQELILFNNKDILIEGKSFYYDEWRKAGILSIKDLLNENGTFLSFQEFSKNILAAQTSFNFTKYLALYPGTY